MKRLEVVGTGLGWGGRRVTNGNTCAGFFYPNPTEPRLDSFEKCQTPMKTRLGCIDDPEGNATEIHPYLKVVQFFCDDRCALKYPSRVSESNIEFSSPTTARAGPGARPPPH